MVCPGSESSQGYSVISDGKEVGRSRVVTFRERGGKVCWGVFNGPLETDRPETQFTSRDSVTDSQG